MTKGDNKGTELASAKVEASSRPHDQPVDGFVYFGVVSQEGHIESIWGRVAGKVTKLLPIVAVGVSSDGSSSGQRLRTCSWCCPYSDRPLVSKLAGC